MSQLIVMSLPRLLVVSKWLYRERLFNLNSFYCKGMGQTIKASYFKEGCEMMKKVICCLSIVGSLVGCTQGGLKVATSIDGPWMLTKDGAIHMYNGSAWSKKEASGTAADFEVCGSHLFVLTRPDAQGVRTIKSRDIYGGGWTTYPNPSVGTVDIVQIGCDGYEPVVLTEAPDMTLYKYYNDSQSWRNIHRGATDFSVENSRLFYLYPTTTTGNVWSRNVDGGSYTRWGENMVASKIAGDANGYPWVATSATSNPLFEWNKTNQKWTFGFSSGPVYDMDIQSYTTMYILSDPKASGGGYSLYSHDLYSGGWSTYPLPKK